IKDFSAPYALVKTMRASILVLGPLLSHYGQAEVALPGGCAIGSRPVNRHISALEKMGAKSAVEDGYIKASVDGRLKGAHIFMDLCTVTGTENGMLAATLREGERSIENDARDQEAVDVANGLIAMAAKISGQGDATIVVGGARLPRGPNYAVTPARNATDTYPIADAATRGPIKVKDTRPDILEVVLGKMKKAGT